MAVCNYTSAEGFPEFKSDEELANVGLFLCYSEALLQFATACCVIFMLIGIPGNLITIVALARCKKVRNATAIFIINLHTSDLIFNILILPMTVMTFMERHWTHGWVMCRVFVYSKYVLISCSILTVLAISINRYVIVCHPLLYPKLYDRRTLAISILMIWAWSLAINLASFFGVWGRFDLEPNEGFCTMVPDLNGATPKKFFIITLVIPYLTIPFCYVRIWWVVKTAKKIQSKKPQAIGPTHLSLSQTQSDIATYGNTLIHSDPSSGSSTNDRDKTLTSRDMSAPQSSEEEKAFKKHFKVPFRITRNLARRKVPTNKDTRLCAMIAAIMISFCISNLPVMAMRLAYKDYKSEPILNVLSHLLLYSGTCMNPIIYVLMSREYRQAYKSLFDSIIRSFGH